MKSTTLMGLGLAVVLGAVIGCGDQPRTTKTEPTQTEKKGGPADDDHTHGEGPNGGVIFDLGKYHAEFTVDHARKECAILFLAGDGKTAKPRPVAAKELTLTTKQTKTQAGQVVPPMTITLKPVDAKDGKASKFVGTDAGLGFVADFAGTVTGEIDGKPSSGEFQEVEHTEAKK